MGYVIVRVSKVVETSRFVVLDESVVSQFHIDNNINKLNDDGKVYQYTREIASFITREQLEYFLDDLNKKNARLK